MDLVIQKLIEMKKAKIALRRLATETKNRVLLRLQDAIKSNATEILNANALDVEEYKNSAKFQLAFVDRLTLTEKRLQQMGESLFEVAAMPEPVGEVVEKRTLENGLILKKSRNPLGILFLIFEARPNVITEAFSLALKSGNALILKGGKESDRTSSVIYRLIEECLQIEGVPAHVFWGLVGVSRETTDFMMKQNKFIDVLIPRGGDQLIEHVTQNSTIPIIKNDRGMCHVYIHEKADLAMALNIINNAKTQRPGVCNAAETLLVDQAIAAEFLPKVYQLLRAKGVTFYVDPEAYAIIGGMDGVLMATGKSFDTEYLDLKLNIAVVKDIGQALEHIELHGSQHSEAIVTRDVSAVKQFQLNVDAAAVYWNASTRFTDGGQLGLGAEIGISTQKLHVRGPVGLEALTSCRWIIEGAGQVRPG
jgi:glutamate-5-semialdehyde dehydrogenase